MREICKFCIYWQATITKETSEIYEIVKDFRCCECSDVHGSDGSNEHDSAAICGDAQFVTGPFFGCVHFIEDKTKVFMAYNP